MLHRGAHHAGGGDGGDALDYAQFKAMVFETCSLTLPDDECRALFAEVRRR